jgi:hypothetical protein
MLLFLLQYIPGNEQINEIILQSSNHGCISVSDAMRAMKELCQQVTNQKMLIMQSLENDCDKGELNSQIAVSSKMADVNQREIYRFWVPLFNVFFVEVGRNIT